MLEIGVGMGADHLELARAKTAELDRRGPHAACDLLRTKERLELHDLPSNLRVADAEALPFSDGSFDLVYSWGVLHHFAKHATGDPRSPSRSSPGRGRARVMIYRAGGRSSDSCCGPATD